MKTLHFLLLALALNLCLISCTKTEWVAAVGTQRISKTQAETRMKMMSSLDPSIDFKKAAEQLISFEIRKQILNSKGVEISEKDYTGFLEGQKNQAKGNPGIATLLKNFEKDPEFQNLYVRPQVVDQKINELYEKDVAFNKAELEKAQAMLSKAQENPAQFEAIAKEMSLPFMKGNVNTQNWMIQWDTGRDLASTSGVPKDAPWFSQMIKNSLLSKAPTGKMVPELKPMWFGYMIVRHDASNKDQFEFSMVVAPRKGRWVWEKENSFTLNVTRFPALVGPQAKK